VPELSILRFSNQQNPHFPQFGIWIGSGTVYDAEPIGLGLWFLVFEKVFENFVILPRFSR
jgi:hypothetical protein